MEKEWFRFGNTFCPYPFLHQHIDIRKNNRLCCLSPVVIGNDNDFNSNDMKNIRQAMLENKPVEACQYCYDYEGRKEVSERQKCLKDMKQHDEVLMSQIQDYKDNKNIKPYWYDLRFSNNCNLECQMCSPDNSSSIAKSMGIENPHLTNEPEIEVNPDSIRIYLSGGEPFLIKKFVDVLDSVSNVNCEIIVNTNATIVTKTMLNLLSKFKNVCMTVSLDGYAELNEKIRLGSNWNVIDRNIDLFKEKNWSIHAQTALQNDNVNHLIPLANYLQTKGVDKWTCQETLGDPRFSWQSNTAIKISNIKPLLSIPLVSRNVQLSGLLRRVLDHAVE